MRSLFLSSELVSSIRNAVRSWTGEGFFRPPSLHTEMEIVSVEETEHFLVCYSKEYAINTSGTYSYVPQGDDFIRFNVVGHRTGRVLLSSHRSSRTCSACGGSCRETYTRQWTEQVRVPSNDYMLSGEHMVRCPDRYVDETRSETLERSCSSCGGSGSEGCYDAEFLSYSTTEEIFIYGNTLLPSGFAKRTAGDKIVADSQAGQFAQVLRQKADELEKRYGVRSDDRSSVVEIQRVDVKVVRYRFQGQQLRTLYLVGRNNEVYSPDSPVSLAKTWTAIEGFFVALVKFVAALGALAILCFIVWKLAIEPRVEQARREQEAKTQAAEAQRVVEVKAQERLEVLELILSETQPLERNQELATALNTRYPDWKETVLVSSFVSQLISSAKERGVDAQANALWFLAHLGASNTEIETFVLDSINQYSDTTQPAESFVAKFLRPRLVRTACVAAVRLRLESTEVGQALERVNNQATSELEFGCSTFAFQGFVTLFLSRRAQLHKDDYFSARGRRSHITESFLRSLGSHGEERSNLLANYLIVTEQLAQMPGWPSEVDEHLKGELRILRTFISKLEQADRQALEIRKNHLEYNLQAFEGAASLESI